MNDIFISYAEEDRPQAERLARALERRGWSVWWDRNVPTGRDFADVIQEALEGVSCVVVLWSEASVTSRWVKVEAEEGAQRNILVPIRIEEVEIPLAFRSIQTADLVGWESTSEAPEIESLVVDIAAVVGRPVTGVPRRERPPETPAKQSGAGRQQHLFLSIAGILVAFSLWGLLRFDQPEAGFFPNDNRVIWIAPSGPAEEAGLEVGDVIQSIDGISTEDPGALREAWLPEIGETHAYVAEREGETLELQLTYGAASRRSRARAYLWAGAGVCLLVFCLWAYFQSPSAATRVLMLFGLCFSLNFVVTYWAWPSPIRRFVFTVVVTLSLIVSLALLVHFLLLFPRRRGLLEKAGGVQMVYLPAAVVALVGLSEVWVNPRFGVVLLLAQVVYYAAAFLLVGRIFMEATPTERSEQGLSLMVVGVILGLLPSAVRLLLQTFAPTVWLPGADFYFPALALIPITFAIAVLRARETSVAGSLAGRAGP